MRFINSRISNDPNELATGTAALAIEIVCNFGGRRFMLGSFRSDNVDVNLDAITRFGVPPTHIHII